jgi:hypothetical protein
MVTNLIVFTGHDDYFHFNIIFKIKEEKYFRRIMRMFGYTFSHNHRTIGCSSRKPKATIYSFNVVFYRNFRNFHQVSKHKHSLNFIT